MTAVSGTAVRLRHRLASAVAAIGGGRLMDSPPPVATSSALSLIGGVFYISGGVVAISVAAVQHDVQHRAPVALVGAAALLTGMLLARFASHLSLSGRRLINFIGTGAILLSVLLAGANPGGEAIFWLFCYIPIDSFCFFQWRWALPMLSWLLAATAIATFWGHVIATAAWCVIVVVNLVVAFVVGWLVRFAAQSEWEPATDMLNRKGFDRELAARCSDGNRGRRGFAIATIKPDGIDQLVASNGMPAGELTLRRVAAQCRKGTPAAATWARIGDLELAVLWSDPTGFGSYLEQVRSGTKLAFPISIGVSDFQRGDTPIQMLSEATTGRAYGERGGGNCVTHAGLVNEQVEELRSAIELGQIVPYYQPVIDLASGRIVGAEALARWLHPQRGMIGPDVFVPLAEQTGLISALGELMLRQACADMAGWCCEGDWSLKIAVNVSGQQLHDDTFVALVKSCLADTDVAPTSLTLEVTESTVAGDDPRARAAVVRLRTLGVEIAMDDFGTGYSNLSRLANLPIDVLKIDQSFIRQLGIPGHAKPLVQGLLSLAEGLGLRTVVEGIELSEQAEFVTKCGAHQGQGWLFGYPVPNAQFPLFRRPATPEPAICAR